MKSGAYKTELVAKFSFSCLKNSGHSEFPLMFPLSDFLFNGSVNGATKLENIGMYCRSYPATPKTLTSALFLEIDKSIIAVTFNFELETAFLRHN
ncbi:hypothetical protein TNIN_383791 [Trichonephila inaurata madagascariensis]|uniref:Uncharacterized protein n=1 Tax=Trichonephila inaurata madagascariensis TaxID=2747483 RepID=A0A8X6YLX3_9ARAC|nr:hypothetical protein TNIN_383791 [Trichonephila inaurata madagascariensis]